MRTTPQVLLILACSAFLAGGAAEVAAKQSKKNKRAEQATVWVDSWLQLGPAPHPPPVFFEQGDELKLEELLGEDPFAGDWPRPRAGGEMVWFDGEPLRWTEVAAGKRHEVEITPPAGEGEGLPALALLAAYVTVDRFVEVELQLEGTQAQCAWIDGELVVECGGRDEEELEGEAELTPGTHLLVLQAARDPRADRPWRVAAALEPNGEDEATPPRIAVSTSPERDLDILDVLDAPQVGSLAVSPDGRQLALIFTRVIPGTDDEQKWIEVRRATDGRVTESWREPRASAIAWSPDGRYLSWIGAAKDKTSALVLYEQSSGRRRPLLDAVEELAGYRWSPTGRVVAYWTSEEAEEDKRGVKRVEGLMDRWADFRDKQYLHLATVPDGVTRRLTQGELSTSAQDFSPDGRRLLFNRQVDDYTERPYSRNELWEVDLASFEATKLREFRWLEEASYSPDGRQLLVRAQPGEFGEQGENVPEGAVSNSYDSQLFLWDPASGDADAITRDFDPTVLQAEWSTHDGKIYLLAGERDYRRLYRYDPAGRRFTRLESGFDVPRLMAVARKSAVAAMAGSSAWSPQGLAVVDLAQGKARRIEHPNQSWFADMRRGRVESWSFTASNGKRIDGRVYLPPQFDREGKYPCIVYYYGGTSPVDRSFGGRYPKEWWATRGYVVYVLQPTGATGFGQAFSADHVNDWGKTSADEVIEGTRRFLETHPYVDAERVGCIGASYGGFMTMLLATKTDLYAAAVAHAGISSLSSYWGEGYWGYSYSAVATAESFPWNRRDIYVEQSPLFRADRTRVPILLTHGRSDTNVPVGESDAFYVALKLLGKEVEYVQIEGQNHWIMDHDKRLVWSQTILAWFDRWLKDDPAWWNALYP